MLFPLLFREFPHLRILHKEHFMKQFSILLHCVDILDWFRFEKSYNIERMNDQSERSREVRTLPPSVGFLGIFIGSPHYFYKKFTEIRKKNMSVLWYWRLKGFKISLALIVP